VPPLESPQRRHSTVGGGCRCGRCRVEGWKHGGHTGSMETMEAFPNAHLVASTHLE
jgi:hypothetical protein